MIQQLSNLLLTQGRVLHITNPNSPLVLANVQHPERDLNCDLIAKDLIDEIDFFRDTAIPTIHSTVDLITQIFETKKAETLIDLEKEIIKVSMPEVILELIDGNEIKNTTKYTLPKRVVITPSDLNGKDIREGILNAYSGFLKQSVEEYILTVTDEELFNVWDNYIRYNSSSKFSFNFSNYNDLVMLYFILVAINKLMFRSEITTETMAGMFRVMLANVEADMLHYKNQFEMHDRNHNVIIGSTDKAIYVNSVEFSDFISSNSINIIYGCGLALCSRENLILNSALYTKRRKLELEKRSIMVNIEQESFLKNLYVTQLSEAYRDLDSPRYTAHLPNVVHDISVVVNDYKGDLLNITEFVFHVFCNEIFSVSNLDRFIKYSRNLKEVYPELGIREISAYASLEMIVDYLMLDIDILKL